MVSPYIRLVPLWYRVDHERTTCFGHASSNRLAVLDIVIDARSLGCGPLYVGEGVEN